MAVQSAFFEKETIKLAQRKENWRTEFQTPPFAAKYMCGLIPDNCISILEPTPGIGNIVREIPDRCKITALDDFFARDLNEYYDCIVMNPPFSSTWVFNMAGRLRKRHEGWLSNDVRLHATNRSSDCIDAVVYDISDKRLREIYRYGLRSVTALPRKTFQYARIQTVVLEMQKGYTGTTDFKVYDCLNDHLKPQLF